MAMPVFTLLSLTSWHNILPQTLKIFLIAPTFDWIHETSKIVSHECISHTVSVASYLCVFVIETINVILVSSPLSVSYLFNPSIPQERDPSNVSSATSPPLRSPTYRGTNVFTPGRNRTAAPGATTGTGSLTRPRLVAQMAATMALMIRGLIGGGRMGCGGYISE